MHSIKSKHNKLAKKLGLVLRNKNIIRKTVILLLPIILFSLIYQVIIYFPNLAQTLISFSGSNYAIALANVLNKLLFVILGLIPLLILFTSYISYKLHVKPLRIEDPYAPYTLKHHTKIVILPLVRYKKKQISFVLTYPVILLIFISLGISLSIGKVLAATPILSTNSPLYVTQSSAKLIANLSQLGDEAALIKRGFEYGTTLSYGGDIDASGSIITGEYSTFVRQLPCNTTYNFRAYVENANNVKTYGSNQTFTTVQCFAPNEFVTRWKTDNPGETANNQIRLPVYNIYGSNFNVDWGDGTTSSNVTDTGGAAPYTHTYASPGEYIVKITGDYKNFGFSGGDPEKLVSVMQWGSSPKIMNGTFAYTSGVKLEAGDIPNIEPNSSMFDTFLDSDFNEPINHWDVSNVVSMERTFLLANEFNQPLNSWNVSNVTNMDAMFSYATKFNQDISSWNVSNVNDMSDMFQNARAFNQSLNNWDVSGVTNMESMFYNALVFNQPLNSWDVSSVTSMKSMFHNAEDFNQPLSLWNVSSVTNMEGMFFDAESFNQNINSWTVTSVTNMKDMFYGATVFNQPLNSWDVSSVTNMAYMFYGANAFNQNINVWDVSSVTNMEGMFNFASDFNQNINSWDVSSVTNMKNMFNFASDFNQNLDNWNVNNVITMDSMFTNASSFDQSLGFWVLTNISNMTNMLIGTKMSVGNYDATLFGWSANELPLYITLDANGLVYCAAEQERQTIIDLYGWAINDSGQLCLPQTDISITQELLSETPILSGQNVSYKITITNNGPDPVQAPGFINNSLPEENGNLKFFAYFTFPDEFTYSSNTATNLSCLTQDIYEIPIFGEYGPVGIACETVLGGDGIQQELPQFILNSGQSMEFNINGTANADFINSSTQLIGISGSSIYVTGYYVGPYYPDANLEFLEGTEIFPTDIETLLTYSLGNNKNTWTYSYSEPDYTPLVTTLPVTDLARKQATLNGVISDDKNIQIDERGFEIEIEGSGPIIVGDTGDQPFDHVLNDLNCGTEYSYRAYAENVNNQKGYGEYINFTTLDCPSFDLSVSQDLITPLPILAGQDVTYRISLTNSGPDSIDNDYLIVVLPTGVLFSNVSAPYSCIDISVDEVNGELFSQYRDQFYPGSQILACSFESNIPLNPGTRTLDITGTSSVNLVNNQSKNRVYYLTSQVDNPDVGSIDFYEALEPGPNDWQDIFSLNNNNYFIWTYNFIPNTPPPDPDIPTPPSSPSYSCTNLQVTFDKNNNNKVAPLNAIFVANSAILNTSLINYSISFGDGKTSTSIDGIFNHTYNNSGSFTAVAKVVTAAGTSAISQKCVIKVNVNGNNPVIVATPVEDLPEQIAQIIPPLLTASYANEVKSVKDTNIIDNAARIPYFFLSLLLLLALFYAIQAYKEYKSGLLAKQLLNRYQLVNNNISSFLSITAHYLNTPIAILKSAVELLTSKNILARSVQANISSELNSLGLYVAQVESNLLDKLENSQNEKAKTTSAIESIKNNYTWVPLIVVAVIVALFDIYLQLTNRYEGTSSQLLNHLIFFILAAILINTANYFRIKFKELKVQRQYLINKEFELNKQKVNLLDNTAEILNQKYTSLQKLSYEIKDFPQTEIYFNGLEMFHKLTSNLLNASNFTLITNNPPLQQISSSINSALDQLTEIINSKKIKLNINISNELNILAQPNEIIYLWTALIENAVKFSPENGNVSINSNKKNDKVYVNISDNGPGIESEKLKNIFQPFNRATSSETYNYEGLGLGLFTAKIIVDKLGGNITLANNTKGGLYVKVQLPLVNKTKNGASGQFSTIITPR